MTTIRTLATRYDMQPYEVAAALDLGRDYDETAKLDGATEAEFVEALDIGAALDETRA